nr:MAG TPA: hypothetical protein [Caudoviricetes sp.]
MKITPEQSAFYEYGRAKMALQIRIGNIRDFALIACRRYYKDMLKSERKLICNQHALGFLVKHLREKRAACRAWSIPSHERICENCDHGGTHPYATPCSECFRCPFAQAYEGFSDNWEPRKEGE